MAKTRIRKIIAVERDNAPDAIMYFLADVDVDKEISKTVWQTPARAWREITEAEAAELRRKRPKPKPAEPLADIPDDASIDELRAKIRQLAAHTLGIAQAHDDMVKRIAQIESTPIVDGIERIEDR